MNNVLIEKKMTKVKGDSRLQLQTKQKIRLHWDPMSL